MNLDKRKLYVYFIFILYFCLYDLIMYKLLVKEIMKYLNSFHVM